MKNKKEKLEFGIKDNILIKYNEIEGKKEVVIPDGVTKIGEYAFWECYNLTSIIISESVTTIGIGAFLDCYNLTNIIISEGITRLESCAFKFCLNLKDIIIPKSVTEIGEAAFESTGITSITIPDSVIGILSNAIDIRIEKINIYSYRVFSMLDSYIKLIALSSTIKNYYTGKIKYSNDDMQLFKEYIRENKLEVFEYLENNKEIIHIILNDMGNFLRKEDIDELLNKFDVEINGMLLEYINKNYNTKSKDIKSIIDNEFDLDKDEEKNKEKKLKKGE